MAQGQPMSDQKVMIGCSEAGAAVMGCSLQAARRPSGQMSVVDPGRPGQRTGGDFVTMRIPRLPATVDLNG
ncbi:hypothetical protein GCM10014713_65370 [Streptomyces purpureus]|uniref:Uncharacterized protein n=1 Tax=Streptomyces purpureus TaxID=1951 RepID=A0A918HH67_9ACTN|nr:hypothetical protein GCM10014713_65370 [Streptomyces purpureus]